MYLARLHTKGEYRYVIRQSYLDSDHYKYRDLFDLGTDPSRFIQYPGGHGYYYDQIIQETISDKGVELEPDDLDHIFFEFLAPEIQRVITGFDRKYRTSAAHSSIPDSDRSSPVHIFDKRRFHYLRFGHSSQRNINKVPEKFFRTLQNKSRDELEYYFVSEERRLRRHEKWPYIMTVFQLSYLHYRTGTDPMGYLDNAFINRLCQLNQDKIFMAGAPESRQKLYGHLIRYAIFYFDAPALQTDPHWQYIRDFINRHRIHRPPAPMQEKISEAENLFGKDWKSLKRMNKAALSRIYRRLALKYHPDQGGNAETFHRLTQFYEALMKRKSKHQ
jgi:hypothetical protein